MRNLIIGVDSETLNGPPITLQFYCLDKPALTKLLWVSGKTAMKNFFEYLESLPENDTHYVIYGHNLAFDAISFFWTKYKILKNEEIDFTYRGWRVTGVYANLVFMRFVKKRKTIHLLDTFAFFPTSLEKLAAIMCPHLPKLKMPDGLGEKQFKKDDDVFKAYAMRDAEIACHVGKNIDALHDEFDISQSVSRANMSSKIFRHDFVKKTIPKIPEDLKLASLHAYNGGKNGIYCEKRKLYRNVYGLDIISAYPWALTQLPSFYEGKCYHSLKAENPKSLPRFGVYRISGTLKKSAYPLLFDHNFKAIPPGDFQNVWLCSPEVNLALKEKLLSIDSLEGFFYDETKDKNISPWKEFSETIFEKKNQAERSGNSLYREVWKNILNSLYGKTIERTKISSSEEEGWNLLNDTPIDNTLYRPGRLFHPFCAALITSFVRAKLFKEMEVPFQAIHTSTDGIFSPGKPDEKQGLGGLKIDFFGDVYIYRNKFYVCYTQDESKAMKWKDKKTGKEITLKSEYVSNRFISKFVHHGFYERDPRVFERMLIDGIQDYEYNKVNKLRESLRSNWIPNQFIQRQGVLGV